MKKLFAAAVSLAMLGSLTACGAESSSSSEKSSEKSSSSSVYIGDKTIGISMPASELERWNRDGEYLKNQFESAGYKVELTYSNNDPAQQNLDVNGMIKNEVDLLLIAAVDANSLSNTLESAKESNIPVVAYDRLIMGTDAVTYYISFDNYAVGRLQAEFVKNMLSLDTNPATYNIEFVAGDAADNNAKCFFDGAYEVLKPLITSGTLNVASGKTEFDQVATKGWTSENAEKNMTETLNTFYADADLDIALCANDSTALGVTRAIEAVKGGSKFPLTTGQDGDIENLKNIVDGKQAMTVYKNVNDESSVAVDVCKAILSGNTPAASLVESLSAEVNYDTSSYNNGKKYVQSYLLVPTVITKSELQFLVDTGNYKWDSDKKYLEKS